MTNKLFLYRIKDSEDRDCCAYIEDRNFENRFDCGHYFGSIALCGACYCGHTLAKYEDIETILTKKEYNQLIAIDKEFDKLGFGIDKYSDRYNKGIEICNRLEPILAKLKSVEAKKFFNEIVKSEKEFVMGQWNLSKEDVDKIFDETTDDYKDRSIVMYVYENVTEVARHYADDVDCIPENLEKYFDYEQYGADIIDDGSFLVLSDGRVIEYAE